MNKLFCLQQVKHVARIQLYVLIVAIALVLCFVPTTNADAATTSVMLKTMAKQKRMTSRQNVEQVVPSENICLSAQQLENAIQARALLLANGTTPAANTTNCPSTVFLFSLLTTIFQRRNHQKQLFGIGDNWSNLWVLCSCCAVQHFVQV